MSRGSFERFAFKLPALRLTPGPSSTTVRDVVCEIFLCVRVAGASVLESACDRLLSHVRPRVDQWFESTTLSDQLVFGQVRDLGEQPFVGRRTLRSRATEGPLDLA